MSFDGDYHYKYNNGSRPGGGPPGKDPGSQDWTDSLSWLIDVAALCTFFPLGIFLILSKWFGRDYVRELLVWFRDRRGQSYTQTAAAHATERRRADSRPAMGKKQKIRRADKGMLPLSVMGWVLAGMGLITGGNQISFLLNYGFTGGAVWNALWGLAAAAGGVILILAGRARGKREKQYMRYQTLTKNGEGHFEIAELAKILGVTEEVAEKELLDMVDRGYFGGTAYVDQARDMLVLDPDSMRDVYAAERAQTRKKEKEYFWQKDEDEPQGETVSEYDRILADIRAANNLIDDEAMSEKITHIETVTASIFRLVQQNPAKLPQIRKFMDYYLPTTMKLLNSYARMEAQGVTGENMSKAKSDIEKIADTLVVGFEKQLDSLYAAEAMDISSDVSVLENMMRRDGLTGGGDFRTAAGGSGE